MGALPEIDDLAKSWALPLSDEERAAWEALPRDEQLRQLRHFFDRKGAKWSL